MRGRRANSAALPYRSPSGVEPVDARPAGHLGSRKDQLVYMDAEIGNWLQCASKVVIVIVVDLHGEEEVLRIDVLMGGSAEAADVEASRYVLDECNIMVRRGEELDRIAGFQLSHRS